MSDFSNFDNNNFSFYKVLSPQNSDQKIQFSKAQSAGSKSIEGQTTLDKLRTYYITGNKASEDIVKDLQKESSTNGKGIIYNSAHVSKGATTTNFLDKEYWKIEDLNESGKFKEIINFWFDVCGQKGSPEIDFSVNVLTTPYVSPSTRDSDKIEFFLNYMPSIFASQMSPYLEVEFQIPYNEYENEQGKDVYAKDMSLLRFLEGSKKINSLTDADQSLVRAIKDPGSRQKNAGSSRFVGMEMFTTPQTLTNMNTLNASSDRLVPVKPFLPPASLAGASIQLQNAGAGKFAHKTASVEIKIHDKARLVEFSEFIRGGAGYRNITVWLTYGWLAPRSRGEEDQYARFINYNMLKKEAFMVKNAGFSFDAVGQVSVKLDLVSKGYTGIQSDYMDILQNTDKHLNLQIRALIDKIKSLRKSFGNTPEGQEVRIFQILDSAADGEINSPLKPKELNDLLVKTQKSVEASTTIDAERKKQIKELLNAVGELYGASGSDNFDTSVKGRAARKLKADIRSTFQNVLQKESPDPFFPVAGKKVKAGDTTIDLFDPEIIKTVSEAPSKPKDPKKPQIPKVDKKSPQAKKEEAKQAKDDATREAEANKQEAELLGNPARRRELAIEWWHADGHGGNQLSLEGARSIFKDPKGPREQELKEYLDLAQALSDEAAEKVRAATTAPGGPGVGVEKSGKYSNSRSYISFGKLFCAFCLPSLMASAKREGIDDVQVNFYQLNDSCGPLSLYNIAEFPIDVRSFVDQFGDFASARGGDRMTVEDFLNFIVTTQINDKRAPGYGMSQFYEPYSKSKDPSALKGDNVQLEANMAAWFSKWGNLKEPSIAIKMETVNTVTGKTDVGTDLLLKLQQSLIEKENSPPKPVEPGPTTKIIKRIHIYDKQLSPYSNQRKMLYNNVFGQFATYEQTGKLGRRLTNDSAKFEAQIVENAQTISQNKTPDQAKIDSERIKAAGQEAYNAAKKRGLMEAQRQEARKLAEDQAVEQSTSTYSINRVQGSNVGAPKGQPNINILRELIKDTIPTITIGTNGSLVTNASLASKMDGLLGTINALGGSFKAKSTVAANGLTMEAYNLPMRVIPAQLTMNSMGCPIADLYQQYFIDFGTGTTIDNLYACTQLQHTLNPGKFETSWTFAYTDGYGQFFGAETIEEHLKKITEEANAPLQTAQPAKPPAKPAKTPPKK